MAFPNIGTKGFKSQPDIEAYIAAFNADDFETYFQYYHPKVCVGDHCILKQVLGGSLAAGMSVYVRATADLLIDRYFSNTW